MSNFHLHTLKDTISPQSLPSPAPQKKKLANYFVCAVFAAPLSNRFHTFELEAVFGYGQCTLWMAMIP
jgi:hypothetical protein